MIRAWMIGRIGKDAEVKGGEKGKYVVMDVATDIYHQGQNKTDWVRVYCNNPRMVKLVEEKNQFKKGSQVEVQGSVTFPSAWVSKKTGEIAAQNVMLADMVQYAGGRRKDGKATEAGETAPQQGGQQMPFDAPAQDEAAPF